ncbi:hypothetical protein BYT27DRAFT_7252663 [Phlegmacium glaucopus]|nr:hypothetical protein BYT27DRAFT_7252663 [Phlegmacium glaucopus]
MRGGKARLQAASASIHQSHGQHIENVHLQTYTSEEHFWDVLYQEQYSKLFTKAIEFLDAVGGAGDDVMIFISVNEGWWNVENLIKLETGTKKRCGGRPSLPSSSSPDPWLERAMTTFRPLYGSMTLRNRTKLKSPVPISSSLSANGTKLITGNTVGDDQKDGASASSVGGQSSVEDGGSVIRLEFDETLTMKRLPPVILRLGKPPDPPV